MHASTFFTRRYSDGGHQGEEGIIVDRSDDASMKRFNVVPFNVTRPAKIHFPREISIVSISSTRYDYLYDRNSIFFSFLSLFLY